MLAEGRWIPLPKNKQSIVKSYSGNSGNSSISVKGKGLTNIKMYVERKGFFFQKVKFTYKATKYEVSVLQQV